MRRILVVDDEPKILRLIGDLLEDSGYAVERAATGASARRALQGDGFDLLVTDVRLPDCSGVDLLREAKEHSPSLQAILITAYGTVSEAVEAMRLGAFDYLQKPFDMEALCCLVERALDTVRLREQIQVLKADVERRHPGRRLVGEGPAMGRVRELLSKVAPTPSTVLLLGESGTGKELVAETIHAQGPGPDRPLVRVNCLAIPPELMESELFGHVKGAFTGAHAGRRGWFELAQGGTLFLDEIADLPLPLQGKLLRALEERRITRVGGSREIPVEFRLIAACNVDLRHRVDEGGFREDLYYRLAVFPIVLPPLRERREDLPALVASLLQEVGVRLGYPPSEIDGEVLEALQAYSWPGNIRELRNILERAMVLAQGEPITLAHLPRELLDQEASLPSGSVALAGSFNERVEAFKAELLLDALRSCGWVKKQAAEMLGLSPRALSYYITRLGLERHRDQGRGSGVAPP